MSLVRLNIKGISYSQTQSGAYALILSEVDGQRKLPIVIGAFEAQSIAIALEKDIEPPRPLTHDLFKNFSDRFDIVTYKNILEKAGIILKTDSRKEDDEDQPEDVLLFEDLEFETEEIEVSDDGYPSKSIKELQELLTKAVANEDYETAAKLRDEISKR